jgi:Ran GTPase-activating protein (RanGAP) involved in mRNA processing and transport
MKRPKTSNSINIKKPQMQDNKQSQQMDFSEYLDDEDDENILSPELKNKNDLTSTIYSLFSKKIYAELYYAWCKDCNESPSAEGAKYFREELLSRNNKDLKNFNFKSLRVSRNFLAAFGGNLPPAQIHKLELPDNLVNDECMHNIKNLISARQVIHLNLASNQISTEGLKIIQHEVIASKSLKYLNLGVSEGSFRVNNFSGDGGIIIARILLNNTSIETLILQENLLGEDAGDKIGAALIQNKTLKKLVLSDNKIKNKGARSIIENGTSLVSIDLSDNDINPEVCYDLKNLMTHSKHLREIIWNGNFIGIKGINFIVDALQQGSKIKSLSLRNTSIGRVGVQALAQGLYQNEYLKILDLGSNSITFESFKDLCDSLNNNKIRTLRLRNNLLKDEGAKYFSENILNKESNSCLTNFDFSACKIYDQGLIYLLNGLINNERINWINLRDNYFSHEIDFVILKFLEKNTYLTHIDLTKNRFSFQCLQKVNKIIKRNRNIQNNKEPNKLLVELYSLKYENTKLNELKETLKIIENDNAKLKLNKIDLRQDYELEKKKAAEKMADTLKEIKSNQETLVLRKKELKEKTEILEQKKIENEQIIKDLEEKYESILKEKEEAMKFKEKIKKDMEELQSEMTKKIVQLNDDIEKNRKLEQEVMRDAQELSTKLDELDEKIQKREEELKEQGLELRKPEEEKKEEKIENKKEEVKKEEKKEEINKDKDNKKKKGKSKKKKK